MIDDDADETLDGPIWNDVLAAVSNEPTVVSDWGAATSQGLARARNEDAWGHDGARLFVVADGMGGYEGGDVAAEIAVRCLVAASARSQSVDWERWLAAANMAIRASAVQRGFERSGAAVVGCSVADGVVTVAHVGDARAYRLSGRELHCLTSDHTVGQELIDDVAGADGTGVTARQLGALTRFLGGGDERAKPSEVTALPRPGDRLILCSDGVSKQLTSDELAVLGSASDAGHAARSIVEQADTNGGFDNATAVCIDFERRVTATGQVGPTPTTESKGTTTND